MQRYAEGSSGLTQQIEHNEEEQPLSLTLKESYANRQNSSTDKFSIQNYIIKSKSFAFCLKIVIGVFVAIAFLKIVAESQKKTRLQKSKHASTDFIYIETGYGNFVQLPYQKPYVIIPHPVFESDLQRINFQKNSSQYEKQISKMFTTFEFRLNLLRNWQSQDQDLFQLEYFILNKTYKLDSFAPEKGLCIISPFSNLMKNSPNRMESLYFKSLNAQNYSNYRVYLIDDGSLDNSTQYILELIRSYPRLNNRMTILQQKQALGMLANMDIVIRNYCQPGEIVIKINLEDLLIGKQALNLINRFYLNDSVWFAYTNYAFLKDKISLYAKDDVILASSNIHPGLNEQINSQILKENRYRPDGQWVTYSFCLFLRDLYVKIPPSHLIERGSGKYYQSSSDLFIGFALIELAGPSHTFFYPEFLYFDFIEEENVATECQKPIRQKCLAIARALVPLQQITTFQDEVKQKKQYKLSPDVMRNFIQKQRQFLICSEAQKKIDRIFDETL